MPLFEKRSLLPVPAAEAFRWHARPGALLRLTPPWERVEILEEGRGLETGTRVVVRTWLGPFPKTWVAEHFDFVEGRLFRDRQESGPFRKWEHTHEMLPVDAGRCELRDRVDYLLPRGGALLLGGWVRKRLRRLFDYRHVLLASDLEAHRGVAPMRIRFDGDGGAFGRMLAAFLTTGGHQVGAEGDRTVRFEEGAAVVRGERIALRRGARPSERERAIARIYDLLKSV